jgi:hypothetical protein
MLPKAVILVFIMFAVYEENLIISFIKTLIAGTLESWSFK